MKEMMNFNINLMVGKKMKDMQIKLFRLLLLGLIFLGNKEISQKKYCTEVLG